MNSGCYGNDISKVLVSINSIDIHDCMRKRLKNTKLNFSYRGFKFTEINDYYFGQIKRNKKIKRKLKKTK